MHHPSFLGEETKLSTMAVAPSSSLNLFIVGLVFLLVVPHLLPHVSSKAVFSDELINGDSPKSHPASTPLSRLNSSIRRSASYDDYLRTANPGNANSPLVSINKEGGEGGAGNANAPNEKKGFSALVTSYYYHYLVSFQIGVQKHNVYLVLEVVEDFTWLFCKPCPTCPEGRPIFDPSMSTNSYYKLRCNDDYCKKLKGHYCVGDECHFNHRYNPGTATGTLSGDTLTMKTANGNKRNFDLENVTFGCANEIEGNQFQDSMGVLGLGSGDLSLIRQMGARGLKKRFSYCLPKNNSYSTYLYFAFAVKDYRNMHWTYLDSSEPPFHQISLTAIYVGSYSHSRPTEDMIVISTSIFYTFIDIESLQFICREMREHVTLPEIRHEEYALCYDTSNAPVNFKMPKITLIFSRNEEFVLDEDNAFVRVGNALCLAILSNEKTRGISILGNSAQKGYRMIFDVDQEKFRFEHNFD